MAALWQAVSGMGFLVLLATWRGLLLIPLVVVGAVIARRGPAPARILLLLPLTWLAALTLLGGVSIPHPSGPAVGHAFAAGWIAILITGLIAPVFARQYSVVSRWTVAWLGLNFVAGVSSLAVIGLITFST
jgi:hypothetical protein